MSEGFPGGGLVSLLPRLLIPQAWLRRLVLAGAALLLCAFFLDGVFAWDKAKAFALVGIVLLILLPLMSLPGQIISLASCRPLSLLGNGRWLLFNSLLIICALLSLASYWVLSLCAKEEISFSFLLLIGLLVSFSFACSVWLSSRWAFAREAAFVVYSLCLARYAHLLIALGPLYWGVLLALTWLVFACWWFRWQPEKYRSNLFFLPPTAAQQVEIQRRMQWALVSGRANSWLGSRLLGAADSWGRRAKEMLALPIFLTVVFIPLALFFTQFLTQIKLGVSMILLLITSGVGLNIAFNLYRFLPMVWLTSSVGREQLFALLWKYFWVETAVGIFTIFALLLLWELAVGKWSGASYWLLLLGAVLLFQTTNFFLVSWIFLKDSMGIKSLVAITPILTGAWFFCLWATGLVFPLPFGWQGISTHWLWVPESIALALLYRPVRSGFASINLVRVAR